MLCKEGPDLSDVVQCKIEQFLQCGLVPKMNEGLTGLEQIN